MSKQDKIKILLATFFFGLGIILASLAIQNYQVRTQTRADDTQSIDVSLQSNNRLGVLDQGFGFIVSDITNTTIINEINDIFKSANRDSVEKSVIIKLVNPTVETIQNSNFQRLQANGFRWYFSFTNFTNVEPVLAEYYKTNTSEVIVEITNYDNFDVTKIDPILTTYPKVKFHAAEFTFWPREQVKELLTKAPPPKLNAVSIKTIVNGNTSIKENVLLMFDTFWDASSDEPGDSNIEINYPANTKLALSDIQTKEGGVLNEEQARRYGIISSALMSGIATQGAADKAPIEYVIAGDYAKMAVFERQMLLSYAHILHNRPEVMWPNLTSSNGNAAREIDPIIGMTAYKDSNYFGIFTNITGDPVTINLTDNINLAEYKTLSNQKGPGDMITTDNTIVLQAYETVYFFPSSSWIELQASTTLTPTGPANGATPFPTLPNIPQTAGQLVCDAGLDPYDSTVIRVTNNTNQTIDDLTSVVFRCEYEPGRIVKGKYKCETCLDGDEVNDPNCQKGIYDPTASIVEFTLAPGETKELKMALNNCEIGQIDVYNTDPNVNDSPLECFNPRSQYTNPAPPTRWPGGIGFAIDENATGYSNGNCEVPTATPTPTTPPATPTNTPALTNTPTATPTPLPTNTPAPTNTPLPTNTVIPTNTPAPTNSPMPTYTPIPTYTQYPTNTPITKLEVNEQPPGITPWVIIAVPIGLILIGLLL